jgi:hypothetical protein
MLLSFLIVIYRGIALTKPMKLVLDFAFRFWYVLCFVKNLAEKLQLARITLLISRDKIQQCQSELSCQIC